MDSSEATRLSRSKAMERVPGILESIYDEIRFNVSVGWIHYVIENASCIVGSDSQTIYELVQSELEKKGYSVYLCCDDDCPNDGDLVTDDDTNRYDQCLSISWDI